MSNTSTRDLVDKEVTVYEQAVQQMFDEMSQANVKMERDQEEIERVKAETRKILARLKAA